MDILRSFADAITRVLDRFYISSVRKDPESILYMKDPSLNVILALSERAPEFIPYIQGNYADKLTDDVKQAMVKINPNVIEWFPDDGTCFGLCADVRRASDYLYHGRLQMGRMYSCYRGKVSS